ncbi:hypothetical protein MBLNU457_3526t1 [Dothideomycetes sp. NU457]
MDSVRILPRRTSESGDDVTQTELDLDHDTHKRMPVINRTVAKTTKKGTATAKAATNSKKAPAKSKAQREALKDRTNIRDASDEEEVDEVMDEEENAPKPKGKKARTADTSEDTDAPAKKKARATKAKSDDAKVENAPAAKSRKTAVQKRAASVEPMRIIPETQTVEDVSESVEIDPDQMVAESQPTPEHIQRALQRARSASLQRSLQMNGAGKRGRSVSQQPQHYSRERSASDATRRVAESESKRKLAEMTSNYEDMRLKYESLQELGRNGAESNFDKLKRATDQRAKDANDLIAALKKELADARKSTSSGSTENAKLQSQISNLETAAEKSQNENKDLSTRLSEAQNEVRALTAKLEAARKSANTVAEAAKQAPGSAVKSRDIASNRAQLQGNLDTAKTAALKEELYRDLTGLIINSIKRREGEDEYSCIQTGRNGTLHFHLTINNDSSSINPKTPSGLSYEDAEFAYEPFFDEDRDRELIDILPDYLTEEICFPRNHAVKFYTKVVDSMTRKVVVEE